MKVEAERLSNILVEVKDEALLDSLADTLEELKAETGEKLAEMKTDPIVEIINYC